MAMTFLLIYGQHLGTYKYVNEICIIKELPYCGLLVLSTDTKKFTEEEMETFSCRLNVINKCKKPFEKDDL